MELVTAILAGNRTLELRVFSSANVSTAVEHTLTKTLCKQMDRHAAIWKRYDSLDNIVVPPPALEKTTLIPCFRLNCMYFIDQADDRKKIVGLDRLKRTAEAAGLDIVMIDCLSSRYMDLYCLE